MRGAVRLGMGGWMRAPRRCQRVRRYPQRHTAAPAHPTTHPRPSSRPSGCPHSARVPQAEQSVGARVWHGGGGRRESPIVRIKKAGTRLSARPLRTARPRAAQGYRRCLPTPGGAGCSTPASPALGGRAPGRAQRHRVLSHCSTRSSLQCSPPSKGIHWVRTLGVYN